MDNPIYFDNAATSWPKPSCVGEAIKTYLDEVGGSPGRSGHRMSISASRIVEGARESVGRIFNCPDTSRIIFTKNITEALNICIFSLLNPGAHAVVSSAEHNSVMRPLRLLEKRGLRLAVVECSPDGTLDAGKLRQQINEHTGLVVLAHASNVTGTILPIEEAASIAGEMEVPLLVDCAQTAGAVPIDINLEDYPNCILAFTGHKSLFGPTGTGGMCIGTGVELFPLMFGGTGSKSDRDTQPDFYPDMLESGTLNVAGIAGLKAGVDFILDRGVGSIREHEKQLVEQFIHEASRIPGVAVYGTGDPQKQAGLLSFNIQGMSPSEVGFVLDRKYSIMCRIGLHCNPSAHKTSRTFPHGTVRFGFTWFNTSDQVRSSIAALEELSRQIKNQCAE